MHTILTGHVLDRLREIPDASVDCIVTSPPYWGLRDYGVDGQIGLETSFAEFLANLTAVFEECKRVLKKTGTLWVNMGDSYTPDGKHGGSSGSKNESSKKAGYDRTGRKCGLKPKNLIGQPWRLAFALQDAGWILRSDIIWHKPSPMPSSAKDRPTVAHEYIFLFAKSQRYHYDHEAIAEPLAAASVARLSQDIDNQLGSDRAHAGGKTNGRMKAVSGWDSGPGSHATTDHAKVKVPAAYKGSVPGRKFGPGQDRRSTKDRSLGPKGTAADTDTDASSASARMGRGAGWRNDPSTSTATRNARTVWTIASKGYPEAHFATFPEELPKRCILAGCPEGGTVLDPFAGSGTTLAVAVALGRKAIGIELNESYVALIEKRMATVTPSLFLEAAS